MNITQYKTSAKSRAKEIAVKKAKALAYKYIWEDENGKWHVARDFRSIPNINLSCNKPCEYHDHMKSWIKI